jgi:hypothetical protein
MPTCPPGRFDRAPPRIVDSEPKDHDSLPGGIRCGDRPDGIIARNRTFDNMMSFCVDGCYVACKRRQQHLGVHGIRPGFGERNYGTKVIENRGRDHRRNPIACASHDPPVMMSDCRDPGFLGNQHVGGEGHGEVESVPSPSGEEQLGMIPDVTDRVDRLHGQGRAFTWPVWRSRLNVSNAAFTITNSSPWKTGDFGPRGIGCKTEPAPINRSTASRVIENSMTVPPLLAPKKIASPSSDARKKPAGPSVFNRAASVASRPPPLRNHNADGTSVP